MASKAFPSRLSNLEWFFLTARHHVCMVYCLEGAIDEDGAQAIAQRFDDLIVRPFSLRTGIARDDAGMSANTKVVNSSDPVSLDRVLCDCASWFMRRATRSPALAGLYAIGSGSDGIARELSVPACRSVVVLVATHAMIDGLSLPKVDLDLGPATHRDSEQETALPFAARVRAWLEGSLTAGMDILKAAITRPGAGHFVCLAAGADRARVALSRAGSGSAAKPCATHLHWNRCLPVALRAPSKWRFAPGPYDWATSPRYGSLSPASASMVAVK